MNDHKVLITSPEVVPQVVIDFLKERCTLVVNKRFSTREDILVNCKGVDAILWSCKYRIDEEVLERAGPQMKIICSMSAGLDHIDVDLLKSRDIKLGHTPVEVLNEAVADVAVMLSLGASRRIHEGRLAMERGTWRLGNQWQLGRDIAGSTVGIVGLGRIGQAIVKKLGAFGVARYLYSGHREKPEGKQLNVEFVTFDELLRESDFVIICCPLTDETRNLFDKEAFGKMKNTAILVNIARGEIVDQNDLAEALQTNRIYAAGLDVMTPEPLPKDHILLTLPNCILLPHIGSATYNTRVAMSQLAAESILMGLQGLPMPSPVY